MRLSILIRNYNEAKNLEKTLTLLQKQRVSFPYEIVVSDNNSTDNSVAVAQSFGCRVVHNTTKVFSYGQLLNFGIEKCQGEFVLLLSAHIALLNNDAIENIILPFADEKVGCVCSIAATNTNMVLLATNPQTITIADFTHISDWKKKEIYLFAAPCGAIRKSVWEKIKFDESLEIMEDRHWNRSLLEAGLSSVFGASCYYLYFILRRPGANYKRAYLESLAMYRVFGKAETGDDFYYRSVKTIFSLAYHSVKNIPLGLYNLLKIYAIRFKKR